MKAEHRKELETNTLADKMGQAMQRVKTGGRGTLFASLAIVAALLIVAWFWYRSVASTREEASNAWVLFDDGGGKNLMSLKERDGASTNYGKAASLDYAWIAYWEVGVKKLGSDQRGALGAIDEAGRVYRELAKSCADENPPIFAPQAFLGIALVEETKAIQDRAMLDKAKEAYATVVEKFPETAEGKFAKARLDLLKDKKGRAEIEGIYQELQRQLGVRGLQPVPGDLGLPPGFEPPPVFEKK